VRALRARVESERGSALVTAILVMAIMMSIAVPLMSMVDTQQRMTSAERLQEGSFSLTDAVLNAQVFILSNNWPADDDLAYDTCTQRSVSLKCPSPTAITAIYTGPDYSTSAWSVKVRDDGESAADYYDEAVVNRQPAWDANTNGRVWVRADARGTGTTQSLVAQVKMTEHVENFPRHTTTTGYMTIKHIHKNGILTQGNSAQPAPIVLRCTGPIDKHSSCLNVKK
jgi:Tfp pilus assembly protein PilX